MKERAYIRKKFASGPDSLVSAVSSLLSTADRCVVFYQAVGGVTYTALFYFHVTLSDSLPYSMLASV